MRPADIQTREALRSALRLGPRGNRELEAAAQVSPATVKRILQELRSEIVSGGKTRRRRHALRRQVRGSFSNVETFVIDANGRAAPGSTIELIQPSGCYAHLDSRVWPQAPGQDGWWDGLPHPLYDMRPQGYLGRMLAHDLATKLDVPANPDDWSNEEIIWFLAQFGADAPGNLIVGQRAMQLWTQQREEQQLIPERKVKDAYPQRAQSALKLVGAGSSAGGEFPKFTAARSMSDAATPHVIVKFSGSEETGAARRWADLLVCEHLAMEAIRKMQGHAAARSRIVRAGGRTFLESERFDRVGEHGRSAVVTLAAVEAALIGAGPKAWPAVLQSSAAAGFFEPDVIDRVEELWWFGRFIANTDMHHGNLSLRPHGNRFQLAPAYDMLPMHYAPHRGGDVPDGEYPLQDLPLPRRGSEDRWRGALNAAFSFWGEAGRDKRISEPFRRTCSNNAHSLERWADTWAAAA